MAHRKNQFAYHLGQVLIALGIFMIVTAFVNFFQAFNSFGMPDKFYRFFVGIPMIAVGSMLVAKNKAGGDDTNVTFNGEKTDLSNVPAVKPVTKTAQGILCGCGELNPDDTRFCINCGRKLSLECRVCRTVNAPDANYCKNCAAKL